MVKTKRAERDPNKPMKHQLPPAQRPEQPPAPEHDWSWTDTGLEDGWLLGGGAVENIAGGTSRSAGKPGSLKPAMPGSFKPAFGQMGKPGFAPIGKPDIAPVTPVAVGGGKPPAMGGKPATMGSLKPAMPGGGVTTKKPFNKGWGGLNPFGNKGSLSPFLSHVRKLLPFTYLSVKMNTFAFSSTNK